jgi:hypothetical protein
MWCRWLLATAALLWAACSTAVLDGLRKADHVRSLQFDGEAAQVSPLHGPRPWVQPSEMGIQHCVTQGTLDYRRMTMQGNALEDTAHPRAMMLSLWTRAVRNGTHVAIRSFGQFLDIPNRVKYRFLKAQPGFMSQFKSTFVLYNPASGEVHIPRFVSSTRRAPHQANIAEMRTFHLDAEVPVADMYFLKVDDERWPQACSIVATEVRAGCHSASMRQHSATL